MAGQGRDVRWHGNGPNRPPSLAQIHTLHGTQTRKLVGFEVLTAVVITPYSPLKVWLCLPLAFTLVSSSGYLSALKMEEICSFETSVDYIALYSRRWYSSHVSSIVEQPGLLVC
jgi:hypothetical protein